MRTVKITLLVTSEFVQMTGCYQNNETKKLGAATCWKWGINTRLQQKNRKRMY